MPEVYNSTLRQFGWFRSKIFPTPIFNFIHMVESLSVQEMDCDLGKGGNLMNDARFEL